MKRRAAGADAVVHAGAVEAAAALSRLLQRKAPLSTVEAPPLEAGRVVAIGFTVSGGITGCFAVVLTSDDARHLAGTLLSRGVGGTQGSAGTAWGQRELAPLAELGNIAASAFLNGAAALLDKPCVPSVPAVVVDDAPAALARALGGAPVHVVALDVDGRYIRLATAFAGAR